MEGWTVLQQVLHCRWGCAVGTRCTMTNMKLGKPVMSETAVVCVHSHNNHLVLSGKEIVCNPSVLVRTLLKPSSLIDVFVLCPCGTGPQTPNHIPQSCPAFDALRCQTWPSPADAHRKLWGPVETLWQTADLLTEDLA